MATLVVHAEGAAPSFVPLVKPLTTLAAAADSDVRVPDLRGVVAIQFDGESFIATALEGAHLVVNGKRRGQHTLADGDTMELGGTQLVFQSGERIQPPVALRRDGLSVVESNDPDPPARAAESESSQIGGVHAPQPTAYPFDQRTLADNCYPAPRRSRPSILLHGTSEGISFVGAVVGRANLRVMARFRHVVCDALSMLARSRSRPALLVVAGSEG